MRHAISRLSLIFAAFALVAISAPASAQTQAAPAAQQGAKPTDVKSIGDWGVRCYPVASPSPCEMLELLSQKDTGKRLMSVSIGYTPKQDRHIIQIALPLGVSIQKGVVIVADSYTSPRLQYRRCDNAGCYVEGFIDSAMIGSLSQGSAKATVQIATTDGRAIKLPLSLRGFSQALDALKTLARQKVGGAAPAAAADANH